MNNFNEKIRVYLPISEIELKPAVEQGFDRNYDDGLEINQFQREYRN